MNAQEKKEAEKLKAEIRAFQEKIAAFVARVVAKLPPDLQEEWRKRDGGTRH